VTINTIFQPCSIGAALTGLAIYKIVALEQIDTVIAILRIKYEMTI